MRHQDEHASRPPAGMSVSWVPYGAEAMAALRAAIGTAKAGHPLARVTVIVPTKVSGLGLRRAMSGMPGGSIGVAYLVAAQVAELLAARQVARDGRTPITPAIRTELVREALRQQSGVLDRVAQHAATERAFDRAAVALRQATSVEGETEVLADLRARGGIVGTLADAFAAFRDLSRVHHYDEHDLALAAADAVGRDPSLLDEVGPIIVHLPTRTTPAVTHLVRTLAESVAVTVLLGATGDPAADRATAELGRLLTGVATAAPAGPPQPRLDLTILAPDPEEEVRQAVRHVVAAMHEGRDLSRIALLYRAEDPYATLLHELLDAAEVPHNGPTERRIGQTIAGRFLADALAWHADGLPRRGLFDLLGAVPVVGTDGHAVPTSRWDTAARRARVVGGRAQWDQRLAGAASGAREQRADLAEGHWLIRRLESSAAEADALRTFALALADALDPHDITTWTGWADWADTLLTTYLGTGRGIWPETDVEAEGTIRQRIAALAQLDAVRERLGVQGDVDQAAFREVLAVELDAPAARVGRAGTGVHIGPLGTAGTLDSDEVIILGMTEGQFPPRPRDGAFLPDHVVAAWRETAPVGSPLARAAAALPLADERTTAVRQALYRVLAGAEHTVATLPRADRREQRERLPGPWLLELLAQRNGVRVSVEDLHLHADRIDGVVQLQSALRGLHDAPVPAGPAELRIRNLSLVAEAGGDLTDDSTVAADAVLSAGITVMRARRSDAFTEWDGRVGSEPARLREVLERPASASRVAAYASCPRSYLLAEVLSVNSEDEPRKWLAIDALDRGLLVHATLERWVGESIGSHTPQSEAAAAGSHARLWELFDQECDRVVATGRTGLSALWELERQRIARNLRQFLDADVKVRLTHGVEPHTVELPFGLEGSDALTVELPRVTLQFRGRLDRLDASEDGSKVVVTDYKTGKPGTYRDLAEDIAQGGNELQLPIYGLAASRAFPDAQIHVGYWHVHAAEKQPPTIVAFDATARARTLQVLEAVADGVLDGVFPAHPGDEVVWPVDTHSNCRYCPFDRICPSHAERRRGWERDQKAPGVRAYIEAMQPGQQPGQQPTQEPTP